MANKLKLHIEYRWIYLKNKKGELYEYPQTRGTVDRKLLKRCGIYRWVKITGQNKITCEYIGESGNLYLRLYGYLSKSKSQTTGSRIGRGLKKILDENKKSVIRFQILELSNSRLSGKRITNDSLCSMHIRQAIEQALIFNHKNKGECKLNLEKSELNITP